MMRIAMVTTHPIQYQVPWLQRLSARDDIDLQVYFAMIPDAVEQGRDFGVAFDWDIPLLEGYRYCVLRNRARRPSLFEYSGCDTPQLYGEIRRGHYDAVIVNGWVSKTCVQALLACRLSGTPCIVRGEANGLQPRPAWKKAAHRLMLSQYAAYLAIGTNNRQYYLDRGVPESHIFLTPYCVDNERFGAEAERFRRTFGRAALCERFGLDPARATYLFSGKFVEKKRPGDILAALRRLPTASRERMQVLMVGDGPLGEALRRDGNDLPVKFAGFLNQSEISAAYAVADALVLPSDFGETWGLVVNEAMASGLPAIVSDQVGCAVDLVSPGVSGDVFGCGQVDELAACLERHAGSSAALADMGRLAGERVNAEFNFDRVVDGVMAALSRIGRSRRP